VVEISLIKKTNISDKFLDFSYIISENVNYLISMRNKKNEIVIFKGMADYYNFGSNIK